MAVTATVTHHHTTCSLPRRRKSISTTTTTPSSTGRGSRRRRAPSSSGHHLITTTGTGSRSLPTTPPPPSDALDRVLSDLEAHPRLLTPSLLASLLSAIPRHASPRRRLARLRRLIPVSLLRRHHGALAVRLLHLHASLGLLAYAHHLFDHVLPARAREDALPWTCLVAGYARLGRHHDALALYLQMDEDGVPRDRVTFACAIEACAGAGSLDLGVAVHRDVVRAGLAFDMLLCNALVDMYLQCGDVRRARRVFDAMPVKDSVSWNVMLAGCLRHGGLCPHSIDIWRRMFREGGGHNPWPAALSTMLQLLSSSSFSDSDDDYSKWGLEIHAWVIRHGLDTELSVANALIDMYSEKNELGHALSVFESMPVKDRSSWNAIISAHRNDYSVLMMFRRMVDAGVQPDEMIFATVLSACNNLGLVEGGMRLFSAMENVYRVQPTMEHCACIVNMLGKAGMVNDAYEFVSKRMSLNSEPTVLRDLLRACSVHGNIRIGEIVAENLFDLEPDNEQNFILLMRIYQRAGRLEDMERVKMMMGDTGL
ncbi:hypothetical protein QOZ80_3BG0253000 [Eleusine coracana subsp. coracana]|nr:hypothetical protein QOZ80_3BG0253000 [Eleusine coracana subsp. coracana]